MNKCVKYFARLMSLILVFAFVPTAKAQADGYPLPKSGYCESKYHSLMWNYYDGVLTIHGVGEMDKFKTSSATPWYSFKDEIREIHVLSATPTISAFAFTECKNLVKVTLPDSLKEIGAYAFYNCSSLKEVNIPDRVKKIGDYCFGQCGRLETVDISPYTSTLESIGKNAFEFTKSLMRFEMPDTVTTIGEEAFHISKIYTLRLSRNLSVIPRFAFFDCANLTEVIIPGSVTSIGEGAFECCFKLKKVWYEGNPDFIHNTAFLYCPLESTSRPSEMISYTNDGHGTVIGEYYYETIDSKKFPSGRALILELTVIPDMNYEVDEILLLAENGRPIDVIDRNKEGKYKRILPEPTEHWTIHATFKLKSGAGTKSTPTPTPTPTSAPTPTPTPTPTPVPAESNKKTNPTLEWAREELRKLLKMFR